MVPRATVKPHEIVRAALELVREVGAEALSARNIAKRLGISTMPIYSHYTGMAELEAEVKKQAMQTLMEFQRRPYTDNPFMNMAVGYVEFARAEPHLMELLFLRGQQSPPPEGAELKDVLVQILGDQAQEPASQEVLEIPSIDNLAYKARIFGHGLAMMVYSGELAHLTQGDIIRMLSEAGEAFMLWELHHNK